MFKAMVVDVQQVQPEYLKENSPDGRVADEAKLAAAVAAGLRAAPGLVVVEVPDEVVAPTAPRRSRPIDVGSGG